MSTEFDPDEVVRQVVERLSAKFPDVEPATVQSIVRSEVDVLADRPVHDYVSVLAERAAKRQLKSL
ncbi:three-helix bundle dimerization domain-containing protein [Amnibacterium flavum]|uniref:DUF3562 domain-containing protein n=1 Tax=Amnibacterium flavum TaxID=2173173 RepID=A0A2V1HVB3_9MICO|nr:hypothetical protein [Amnibacterium flavum]PVZ95672.1 hypothetical protein DDQ50_04110 [Amnibacterium flavum]